jgi:hypothetical protein
MGMMRSEAVLLPGFPSAPLPRRCLVKVSIPVRLSP